MPLLTSAARRQAEQVAALAFANPFSPERIALEREVLGKRFSGPRLVWSHQADIDDQPNFHALMEIAGRHAHQLQAALQRCSAVDADELQLYEDLVCFLLYCEFRGDLKELTDRNGVEQSEFLASFWKRYRRRYADYFNLDGRQFSLHLSPGHLLALGFQLRRAFDHTFYSIIGHSLVTADVRASVWQSIFTHDMRRYYRGYYRRMEKHVTLIVGPSGTGKELVARAIGMSRYVPFDERKVRFIGAPDSFVPVNLSALSPNLIESELFGHGKGAFTGAATERAGWLEACGPHGCVFLDEIGDLDARIQVKLLRVFEDRVFQRLGETNSRPFHGKVIAATHRDLAEEIDQGRFRQDFYYRLCSDVIRVPRLAERIGEEPAELRGLVCHLVERETDGDVECLTDEVLQWIDQHLGAGYDWPGNIRELEQCVRNVLIRQHYEPLRLPKRLTTNDPTAALRTATNDLAMPAEELLAWYCTLAFQECGGYEAAADRLGMDRRTLRKRVRLTTDQTLE